MKAIMSWEQCLDEFIKRVEPDNEKISSIIRMCNARQKIINNATIDDETASIIAADYYEIIKELLIALLLKYGLKASNHECLLSFFKKHFPEYEYEITIMHQLKNVRNRALYDGFFVKKEYVLQNQLEFKHIITLLRELINQ